MSRAVISIGSNLGDRLGYLRLAVAGFGGVVDGVSSVYETAPWGVTDQPDFLNAVLIVHEPDTGPRGWLAQAWRLEAAAERRRQGRWGPRSLDVDVVTVDGHVSADPELTLPHPRAHQRAFVLLPWLELEPGARLPGHGVVAELADGLTENERAGVRRVPELVLR